MKDATQRTNVDKVQVIGIRRDGTQEVLGTAPTPPAMRRREIARDVFGEPSSGGDGWADGWSNADLCLGALEVYHEWLIAEGWTAPPLVVTPNV